MCEEPGVEGKGSGGVDREAIMSVVHGVRLSEKSRKGVQVRLGNLWLRKVV